MARLGTIVGVIGVVGLLGIGVAAWALDVAVDAAATGLARDAVRDAGMDGRVRFDDVDFRWLSREIVVEHLVVSGAAPGSPDLRADEAACTWPTVSDEVVVAVRCRVDHLEPVGPVVPGGPPVVVDGALAWDLSTSGHLVGTVELAWRDVASGTWRVDAEGVTTELVRTALDGDGGLDLPTIARLAPDLAIREAAFTVRDRGGRNVLLRLLGPDGGDPDLAGPAAAQALGFGLAALGVPSTGTVEAVEAFVASGGGLRIGTTTTEAVRVFPGGSSGPEAAIAALGAGWQLGVGVTHEP